MSVAVRLLMHPRCRQVTAFVVSDAFDVLNEFCGAWRCPGTRRPSAGLYAHLERRSVRPLAAASRKPCTRVPPHWASSEEAVMKYAPVSWPGAPPGGLTAGIDWASPDHAVCVVGAAGEVV